MKGYPELSRPTWSRYAVAVVASFAALGVTSILWPVLQYMPTMMSFLAVFLVGWYGGGGPSLLALILSAFAVAYFFLPPIHSFRVEDGPTAMRLGGFVAMGLAGTVVFQALWSTRRRQADLLREALREQAAAEQASLRLLRLAAIVDSSEDSIIAKDLDGTIIEWNGGAERLFGYTAAEMIGKPISILMPPEHKTDMDEILSRVRRGERIEQFESVRVRKNGERVPVSLSVSPIKDASGRVVGAAKIARDITEHRRDLEERERLYREAQQATQVREDFLSVAGHELRTPLTTLQFQFHTLKRRLAAGQTVKTAEVLDRAATQLSRLTRLTEQLLDVTRITSGRLDLEREETDLSEVAREAADRFRDAAARAGCEIRITAPAGVKGNWDRSRVDQVVTNLLSNAVKFGEGRPIEIRVEPNTSWARIEVKDGGIGISRDDQAKIFERFERAVSQRSYGGMGLGLWISRQIVEAHGGKIQVSSEPGRGSLFRVELPIGTTKGTVG